MGELCVVGVRHHSPGCARVVASVIERLRPRFVLIEGPSDMNERIDELCLGHRPPVAVYSYLLAEDGGSPRGTWTPFCAYSPEWVALRVGRDAGAEVLFMDLPAWDDAFLEVENRYADRDLGVHGRLVEIARDLGFDSTDTLWDHLFEQPKPTDQLERELADYFEAYRGDDPAGERDTRREAFMARWIAWAMQNAGDRSVVAVCGGYHASALHRLWKASDPSRPHAAAPPGRCGSYLVPYSFRRLDSFTGYAAGMPSPAFYQAVWEGGGDAHERMLFAAVKRLRDKGQRISTADALAASELCSGLAQLRGHAVPTRADVLDGIAGAVFKDALERPPPWTVRDVLPRGTDPILVELVAAFSGDARGELAAGTPRPPLVADVAKLLSSLDLELREEQRTVSLDPFEAGAAARRHVLHRLSLLDIPGVVLVAAPDLRRGTARVQERWKLQLSLETEAALIERAVYGATLEQAALAKLRERVDEAEDAASVVRALSLALVAGYDRVARQLAARAHEGIEREPSFAELGGALEQLLLLQRTERSASPSVVELLDHAIERAAWLLEGRDGPAAPSARDEIRAVAALRSALRDLAGRTPGPAFDAAVAVLGRRAHADAAPPWLRGACLGALWSLYVTVDVDVDARCSVESVATQALGDFLSGLIALARDELLASTLLDVVDARIAGLDESDFLASLPALRAAFAHFPPQERLTIAKRLVTRHPVGVAASDLLANAAAPAVLARGAALEAAAFAQLEHFGLLPEER